MSKKWSSIKNCDYKVFAKKVRKMFNVDISFFPNWMNFIRTDTTEQYNIFNQGNLLLDIKDVQSL